MVLDLLETEAKLDHITPSMKKWRWYSSFPSYLGLYGVYPNPGQNAGLFQVYSVLLSEWNNIKSWVNGATSKGTGKTPKEVEWVEQRQKWLWKTGAMPKVIGVTSKVTGVTPNAV